MLPTVDNSGQFGAENPDSFKDLFVRSIEVTQGVQNLANEMPLVAYRKTWVRVHPNVVGGEQVGEVNAALLLQKSGMPDTVINPVNSGIVAGGVDRTDPNAALNFELDGEWLTGQVTFTASVWTVDPVTITSEPNADNNTMQRTPAVPRDRGAVSHDRPNQRRRRTRS